MLFMHNDLFIDPMIISAASFCIDQPREFDEEFDTDGVGAGKVASCPPEKSS